MTSTRLPHAVCLGGGSLNTFFSSIFRGVLLTPTHMSASAAATKTQSRFSPTINVSLVSTFKDHVNKIQSQGNCLRFIDNTTTLGLSTPQMLYGVHSFTSSQEAQFLHHLEELDALAFEEASHDTSKEEPMEREGTLEGVDMIFILTKGYDATKRAVDQAKNLLEENEHAFVVSLMNGLEHQYVLEKGLADVGRASSKNGRSTSPCKLVLGTTSFGASIPQPGSIAYNGKGVTTLIENNQLLLPSSPFHRYLEDASSSSSSSMAQRLSFSQGSPTQAEATAAVLQCLGMSSVNVVPKEEQASVLWSKLLVNAVINPLTAILRIRNGQLLADDPELQTLVEAVVDEFLAIVTKKEIPLCFGSIKSLEEWESMSPAVQKAAALSHVYSVADQTAFNVSSMASDVLKYRPTEIKSINGILVKEGMRCGVSTPANSTLAALVGSMQHFYDEQIKLQDDLCKQVVVSSPISYRSPLSSSVKTTTPDFNHGHKKKDLNNVRWCKERHVFVAEEAKQGHDGFC